LVKKAFKINSAVKVRLRSGSNHLEDSIHYVLLKIASRLFTFMK